MILVAAVPLLNSGLLNPYMAFCFGWLKPLASNRICLHLRCPTLSTLISDQCIGVGCTKLHSAMTAGNLQSTSPALSADFSQIAIKLHCS